MGRTSDARNKLLQIATELIWEQGYGKVSVDHICERAGVKKGSFYHFFPSKSDLAVAALEEHWQNGRACLDQIFSAQTPPLDRLRNFCEYIYFRQQEKQQHTGRVLGCPYASIGCELSTQDEHIRLKAEELFGRFRTYLESAFRDAQSQGLVCGEDPRDQASLAFSVVLGRLLEARVRNDTGPLKGLYQAVLQTAGMHRTTTTRQFEQTGNVRV